MAKPLGRDVEAWDVDIDGKYVGLGRSEMSSLGTAIKRPVLYGLRLVRPTGGDLLICCAPHSIVPHKKTALVGQGMHSRCFRINYLLLYLDCSSRAFR